MIDFSERWRLDHPIFMGSLAQALHGLYCETKLDGGNIPTAYAIFASRLPTLMPPINSKAERRWTSGAYNCTIAVVRAFLGLPPTDASSSVDFKEKRTAQLVGRNKGFDYISSTPSDLPVSDRTPIPTLIRLCIEMTVPLVNRQMVLALWKCVYDNATVTDATLEATSVFFNRVCLCAKEVDEGSGDDICSEIDTSLSRPREIQQPSAPAPQQAHQCTDRGDEGLATAMSAPCKVLLVEGQAMTSLLACYGFPVVLYSCSPVSSLLSPG